MKGLIFEFDTGHSIYRVWSRESAGGTTIYSLYAGSELMFNTSSLSHVLMSVFKAVGHSCWDMRTVLP